jgi:hypothetical protein
MVKVERPDQSGEYHATDWPCLKSGQYPAASPVSMPRFKSPGAKGKRRSCQPALFSL